MDPEGYAAVKLAWNPPASAFEKLGMDPRFGSWAELVRIYIHIWTFTSIYISSS
jgi:hypothetical protein